MLNDLTALWNARQVALGVVIEQDTKKIFSYNPTQIAFHSL